MTILHSTTARSRRLRTGLSLLLILVLLACSLQACSGCSSSRPPEDGTQPNSLPHYEKRLAIACLGVIPVQFPLGSQYRVWTKTDTDLNRRSESEGVYITLMDQDMAVTLRLTYLHEEPTEKGSLYLQQEMLGLARLEILYNTPVPEGWHEIPLEELSEYAATVTGTQLIEN